jgi:hypothetical protein
MYEYKQENHAWEYDKLISTGKILTKKKWINNSFFFEYI